MDQQNQNNTPDGSGDVPLKRKRGRPRKYPRPDSEESSHMPPSQGKRPNPVRVEQAPVPPGFEGANGNQHLQRGQENDPNDAMVGEVVSGVIEAVFDAGYLLSVRVGDSDTTLRGLVFKPGRYVPLSPENDVAPGVPMIQRNEVPFPSRPAQFQTPLPKEKNGQPANVCRIETPSMNGSPSVPQVSGVGAFNSSNLVASSRKNVASVASQTTTPQLPRGNMVPVLLQPNNFSNGIPVSNQQPPQVTPVSVGSGVIVSKEILVDGIPVSNHQPPRQVTPVPPALTSHAQTSQNTLPSGVQSDGIPHHQPSSNVPNEDTTKSLGPHTVPFEQLVTEVVKRIRAPSDAMDTETENSSKSGDNILEKDPSTRQEEKVNDMDQPILIKPLQAVQSHLQENPASAPKASDYPETGKMTELLQVKQGFDLIIFLLAYVCFHVKVLGCYWCGIECASE